jgi:tetratricopeptide (TPR) repeat protein
LAARIDRLPPVQKALLQAAAVIGRDVPFALLQAITGDSEDIVRAHCSALQAAEFMYDTSVWPQLQYRFKHALTHEVAYGSLLQDRRRALHARIFETLETLSADNVKEHVEELAHHAFHGLIWTKAAVYLSESGMRQYARSANREAATRFEQTLLALDHLPRTAETVATGIDIRFALRNALWPLGRLGQISTRLHEAEGLARESGDQRRLGWVYAYTSNHLLTTSEWKEAVALAERAAAIADEVRDFRLQVAANVYLGSAAFAANDFRKSEHFLRKVVSYVTPELCEERFDLDVYPAVGSRAWLGQALAELGSFRDGARLGLEAVRLATELKHPYSMLSASWRLAYLYCVQGEFGEAIELLERGLPIIEEWNLTLWSEVIKGFLGYAYACSGRPADGIRFMEPVLSEFTGGQAFRSILMIRLAEVYLRQNRLDEAREIAGYGLKIAAASGQRGFEAWGLRLLAQVDLASDPPQLDRAATYGREALDRASELGMRPLVAHCHVVLGHIDRKQGRSVGAREHFVEADRMAQETGMRAPLGLASESPG